MGISTMIDTALLAAEENLAESSMATQWWVTGAVVVALLAALLAVAYRTRSGIIARATTKEAVRQPVFLLVMLLAILVLTVNTYIPFFTFGEDVKMLKDIGLATILTFGLLLAVWTSSTSVSEEIEGKTAMTLLSKPINRRQFVVGKYVGILQTVLLFLIPVSLVFLYWIYYKVGYDARESSKTPPEWFQWTEIQSLGIQIPLPFGERLDSMVQILPGLALIFMEIAVLAAVSVAISTRLPMIVNMVTCFAIFIVGHLSPVLVKTVFQGLEPVRFMAQLIATVLPSLESFNTSAAVATGKIVPPIYLGYAALYSAAYCSIAILLAFLLFEDRDLA